jgi:hypothetical protein
MDATGVVSDHAAESATIVSGGIGCESEVVLFSGGAKMIEHDSGLYAGDAAGGIDFQDLRHVPRKIEYDSDVAALPGKRCAAATAEQGHAELAAECNRCQNIIGIARVHYADGDLAVVGAVRCVESASTAIETDVPARSATKLSAQSFSQALRVYWCGLGGRGEFYESAWHRPDLISSKTSLWSQNYG